MGEEEGGGEWGKGCEREVRAGCLLAEDTGCVREYVCVVLMGNRREGWGEERGGGGETREEGECN